MHGADAPKGNPQLQETEDRNQKTTMKAEMALFPVPRSPFPVPRSLRA